MATTMRQKQLQQQFRMEAAEQRGLHEANGPPHPASAQRLGLRNEGTAADGVDARAGGQGAQLSNILSDAHAKQKELHERGLKNLQYSGSQTHRLPATDRSRRLAPKKWHEDTKGTRARAHEGTRGRGHEVLVPSCPRAIVLSTSRALVPSCPCRLAGRPLGEDS